MKGAEKGDAHFESRRQTCSSAESRELFPRFSRISKGNSAAAIWNCASSGVGPLGFMPCPWLTQILPENVSYRLIDFLAYIRRKLTYSSLVFKRHQIAFKKFESFNLKGLCYSRQNVGLWVFCSPLDAAQENYGLDVSSSVYLG